MKQFLKVFLSYVAFIVLTTAGFTLAGIVTLLDYLALYAEDLEFYLEDKVDDLYMWNLKD